MKPGDADYEAVVQLSRLLSREGIEALTGVYGGLPQALLAGGMRCTAHLFKLVKEGEDYSAFMRVEDCAAWVSLLAQHTGIGVDVDPLGSEDQYFELAWFLSRGLMARADAFCFFRPGERGTFAQAIPILILNWSGWGRNEAPRPVVLIDWSDEDVKKIQPFVGSGSWNEWLYSCHLADIESVARLLMAEVEGPDLP